MALAIRLLAPLGLDLQASATVWLKAGFSAAHGFARAFSCRCGV